MQNRWQRLLAYGLIGATGTVLYAVLAYLFIMRLGFANPPGSALAYTICGIISYFGNRTITFRSKAPVAVEAPRFIVSSLIGYGLATGLPLALQLAGHASPILAILAVCTAVPVANFFLLERFVYKSPMPR
ncbi:MAG: GtrA family protein [Hyphomicrobiales bacterium]|nr:GtrA family protein [Hyphomicrobiales bacterium]MDE2115669.1 GtrA family protein [Hyphomicrobiales bacterium]